MRKFIAALPVAFAQAAKYENLQGHLTSDKTLTPLEITIDGEKHTKYVASDSCSSNGAEFMLLWTSAAKQSTWYTLASRQSAHDSKQ